MKIVLQHGDLVNLKDKNYLYLRKIVRSKIFSFFLSCFSKKKVHQLLNNSEQKIRTTNQRFKMGKFPEQEWKQFLKKITTIFPKSNYCFIGHFHPKTTIITKYQSLKGVICPDWSTAKVYVSLNSKGEVKSREAR